MNQNFYLLGILFTGLFIFTGLIGSIIYFHLGGLFYFQDSFLRWYFLVTVIFLLWAIVLLKYYHYKKYWFAFSTALITTIASLAYTFAFYIMLVEREQSSYHAFLHLLALATGLLYAISLTFSKAGKRQWLKWIGIFTFFYNLLGLILYVRAMNSIDVQLYMEIEIYQQWAALAASFVPILYILNFRNELKVLKGETSVYGSQKLFNRVIASAGAISFALAIGFGSVLINESFWLISWRKNQPERAKKLAESYEARIYVNLEGDTLRYRLMKPINYNPQKKYPLAVCLHGGAGMGTDNIVQVDGSWTAQLLSKQENREKYPAFIFVPQCPPNATWGAVPDLPVVDTLVFEAIRSLEEEFEIDEDRRYVMGESLGGYGSWHFIGIRPDFFAAAIPICGGGDPARAYNMVDVAVWAFHGRKDRAVPVKKSREMIAAIENAGGDPRYTEYPDAGHIISEQFEKTPGLLDWLFAQERD